MRVSQLLHDMDKRDLVDIVFVQNSEGVCTENEVLYFGEVKGISKDDPINKLHVSNIYAENSIIHVLTESLMEERNVMKILRKKPLQKPCVVEIDDECIKATESLIRQGKLAAFIIASDLCVIYDPYARGGGGMFNCDIIGENFFGSIVICGKERDCEEIKIRKLPVTVSGLKKAIPSLWEAPNE